MPNHVLTIGLCSLNLNYSGEEKHLSDLKKINLCQAVKPLPDCLKGITASLNKSRYINKNTQEVWQKDENGPLFNADDTDEWLRVELTPEEKGALLKKCGATNWYDWCCDNWGTKWGTYDLNITEFSTDGFPILVSFNTAWSPVSKDVMILIEEYLQEHWGMINFKWLYHDPSNGSIYNY